MKKLLKKFAGYFAWSEFTASGGYAEVWHVAYPLVIMSASHTVMQFVDRKFLAENSTLDVSAAFPAGILYFTLFCFYFATLNFTNALIAQLFGAGKKTEGLRAFSSAMLLACVFSLVVLFLNPLIGRAVITRFTGDPELAARELQYFSGLLFSGVFCCMAAPFFAFFSGQERTLPAAVINTAACLLNIFLDWILIFGSPKLGIAPHGIWGAGFATTLCTGFSFCAIAVYFFCQNQKKTATRTFHKPCALYIHKILRYGAPAGFQTFSDVGSFTLVSFCFEMVSKEALAASVIALAINNIFFMPLTGLSDATSIVVGRSIGARRLGSATKTTYRAWRMALLYMTMGGVLYLGFPEMLCGVFAPNESAGNGIDFKEVVRICSFILGIAMLFNFSDATKFVVAGALRGAGDTLAVFLINVGCAWLVMVPSVLFLTKVVHCSIYTLWSFLALCAFLEAGLLMWRFRSGAWKKIRMIHGA